ncbi:MAG: SIMPL domain-containing protein [Candidatus Kerfeldbacteria bacterium]|nr:SIMPL domain-containing protein [Candidatus Kerfeldbacteria bacterium]
MIPDSLIAPVRFTLALVALFLCVSIADTSITMVQDAHKLKGEAPARTVTLSGTGTVEATPSEASIIISVVTEGEQQASVQSEGNATMTAVQTAVKELGIEDADIQTNGYSLNPQYDYTSSERTATGYELSQSIEVTIRDVDTVSDVIDAATAAGANSVSTPQFSIEDEEVLKDEARAKAAEAVAAQYASYENTLGVALGDIVSIQELSGGETPIFYALGAAEKDTSSSTPIATGSNEVSVTLSVTYGLR